MNARKRNAVGRNAGGRDGRRKLGVEPLERRLPLAGDVALFVHDGSLRIVGDVFANELAMVQTAAGEFSIVGNDGESFRLDDSPVTGPVIVSGITGTITVQLGRGNDSLSFTGLPDTTSAKRLMVFAGPGADLVSVSSARIDGQLSISTGNGDSNADGDTVSVSDVTVAGPLIVETGAGNDDITIDGVTARRAGVNTAIGADTVSIATRSPVSFDSLLLSLGLGADSLTIGPGTLTVSKGRSRFVGGPGNDSFSGRENLADGSIDRVAVNGFETVT